MAKLRAAGDSLKPVAVNVCRHIDQKTFNDAVVSLGLLAESDLPRGGNDDSDITLASEASAATASSDSNILTVCYYDDVLGTSIYVHTAKSALNIEYAGRRGRSASVLNIEYGRRGRSRL